MIETPTHLAQSFLFLLSLQSCQTFLVCRSYREEIFSGGIFAQCCSMTLHFFLSGVVFLFNCIQLLLKSWLSFASVSFWHFLFSSFSFWPRSIFDDHRCPLHLSLFGFSLLRQLSQTHSHHLFSTDFVDFDADDDCLSDQAKYTRKGCVNTPWQSN